MYAPLAEVRLLDSSELPLKIQLSYGQNSPYFEVRLVQVRDIFTPPVLPPEDVTLGDEEEEEGSNVVPKEEGGNF